ncbi:hypothetical protein [Nonomuraea rubra]|uniref:hypothetical protein n=1 Tax=Nonomuraea rubra TaxID=46180 RepID=UPI0033F2FE53
MSTDREVRIGGLPLPESLIAIIDHGRWEPPEDEGLIEEVFRDHPDGPQFYDIPTMIRQNHSFQRMALGEMFGIDSSRAVIIGDLGADMPIVLDYSIDPAIPRVRYLRINEWLDVAPSIDDLLLMLRINQ